jgi:hypothetical protein
MRKNILFIIINISIFFWVSFTNGDICTSPPNSSPTFQTGDDANLPYICPDNGIPCYLECTDFDPCSGVLACPPNADCVVSCKSTDACNAVNVVECPVSHKFLLLPLFFLLSLFFFFLFLLTRTTNTKNKTNKNKNKNRLMEIVL